MVKRDRALAVITVASKRCPTCKEDKCSSLFRLSVATSDGLSQYCAQCESGYLRSRRYAAREIAETRVTENGKKCIRCGDHKPAADFSASVHTLDGYAQRCDACRRALKEAKAARIRTAGYWGKNLKDRTFWSKYRIREADYNAMLEKQGYACAICKAPPKSDQPLMVDHCHSTKVVRGLLCRGCNTALGGLRDNPVSCRIAADYLEKAEVK